MFDEPACGLEIDCQPKKVPIPPISAKGVKAMRNFLAIATAALVFGSAQAIGSPVQPSVAADARPGGLGLRGPQPGHAQLRADPFFAIVNGSFFDASGKEYQASGTGDFYLVNGSVKYSVALRGYPLLPPGDTIDFGTMSGLGIMEDGRFQIYGVPGSKGYTLDVTGVISNGWIFGDFRLLGNAGSGQGDVTAH